MKASVHTLIIDCAPSQIPETSDPPTTSNGLECTYTLFILLRKVKHIVITVNVNGTDILMEVDTGASLSIISEQTVQGLPNVCVYIDNILVSGISEEDHMQKLEKVLYRLSSAGITLKQSKCTFATTSVEYLGHIIDSTGLHP